LPSWKSVPRPSRGTVIPRIYRHSHSKLAFRRCLVKRCDIRKRVIITVMCQIDDEAPSVSVVMKDHARELASLASQPTHKMSLRNVWKRLSINCCCTTRVLAYRASMSGADVRFEPLRGRGSADSRQSRVSAQAEGPLALAHWNAAMLRAISRHLPRRAYDARLEVRRVDVNGALKGT
jgi:hypothetical protein